MHGQDSLTKNVGKSMSGALYQHYWFWVVKEKAERICIQEAVHFYSIYS